MFYNQNELQWNFNVKTYLFNGKMGLVALFDNGRVWNPGEISDQWHTAIGGGLMIAPFNMISVTGTYAVSKEDQRFSLRIGHLLKK
jgi:outer membrane translocation and assembly module TamA